MNKKHIILIVLKLIVSASLITYIVSKANFSNIIDSIVNANTPLLFTSLLLTFLGLLIIASRWRLLLKAQDIKAPVSTLFRSCLVAMFFNNLLPSTIGGDMVRAYDSWRLGSGKSGAVAVIVVDRFLGLLALITFAAIAISLSQEIGSAVPGIGFWLSCMMVAMLFLVWLVFFAPESSLYSFRHTRLKLPKVIAKLLTKISNAFLVFRNKHAILLFGLLLSFLLQANVVLQYFVVSAALGINVHWSVLFFIVPVNVVIMMLPISINGIGLRETSLAFLFGLFHIDTASAVAFAWILYAIILIQGLIGGLIYAVRR